MPHVLSEEDEQYLAVREQLAEPTEARLLGIIRLLRAQVASVELEMACMLKTKRQDEEER